MIKKKVGTKHFGGKIDITDPGYDKDVWCRMTAEVKDGDYDCVVWIHSKKYKCDEKIINDKRVGIIGIYLDGIIPPQRSMKEIGVIGVDAGLAGFFIDKPDYTNEEWQKFCDSTMGGNFWIKDVGFFSSSGYGDGSYGVYAYKQNKEIVALEIRFI